MKNIKLLIFLIASLLGGSSYSKAEFKATHTTAQLLSEKAFFMPGETIWLGVHLRMEKDWHTYWKNPGDSGMATKIIWNLPKGFSAGEIQWPWPEKTETAGIVSYDYQNEVLLMVPMEVSKDVSSTPSVLIKARVDWLECKDICLPGRTDLEIKLLNGAANTIVDKTVNPLFEFTRQQLPRNLSDEEIIKRISKNNLAANSLSLWKALLFSLLGGLILNLMPCVLPVLSIKILGMIKQSQDNTGERIKQGLLFTLGVLVSFWILAGFVIFIQLGGHQLGWGFQLQSPLFVGAMAILFIVLGLNMWGVFEVGTSLTRVGGVLRQTKGSQYSFLSGVLATIVATPCTAPFMGSAMGFALTQPKIVALLVFTFVGLGMSAPYLLLTAFPVFLRFVPKPGAWMDKLKKLMALFLFATSLWLGWVLWIQLKSSTPTDFSSEPFSFARVEELHRAGTPVLIDFTAAWCLTCQVNKKVVFQNPDVIAKLKEKGVVFLVADWTNRDDTITQALNQYGRNGVPAYVLYGKNPNEAPKVLPEVLTPALLISELDNLK